MGRLTYRNQGIAYLYYGADAKWQKMERYDLIQTAIEKLAEYEEREEKVKDGLIFNVHDLIDDAMEKKDRYVNIFIGEHGVSVDVRPIVESDPEDKPLETKAVRIPTNDNVTVALL